MKFKMAATAGLSLRLDPYMYEKNVSKRFLSETTYAWNQTAQEWSLEGPLQSVCFICQSEIQDGHHHNT